MIKDFVEYNFIAILVATVILVLIGVITAGTIGQNENEAEFRRVCIEHGKSLVVEDLDPRVDVTDVWMVCK